MRALLAALLAVSSAALLAPPAIAAGDGSLTRVGTADGRAIGDPRGIAVSPGGGSVYVTSAQSDAVAVFRRSRRTGRLRQLRGRAGCVRDRGGPGCRRGRALRDPSAVVVSPDGRNVYVASLGSRAIAVFRRNRRTGALHRLAGRAACVRDPGDVSCRDGASLAGLSSLAFTPNGRVLYAGTVTGVATFGRNARTGALVQVTASDGTLRQVGDVAVDSTGRHLYASSPADNAVAVFDISGGEPEQPPGAAGCISDPGTGACAAARTLNGASGLGLSPDGRQLYTAAEFSGAVAILARDSASGALSQPAGPLGCIRDGGGLDCSEARLMGHPDLIEMSRDGLNLYVRAEADDIVVLRRDTATGGLSQVGGRKNLGATAMALSRDGKNVYVTSRDGGGAIVAFRRAR